MLVAGWVDQSSDTHDDEDSPAVSKAIKAKAKDKANEAREAEKKAMQQELMDIEVYIYI